MDCRGVNYLIFYGRVVTADNSLVGLDVAAGVLLIGAKSPMMNARKGFRKSLIFRIDLLILRDMRERFLALLAAFAVLGSLAQAYASTISIRVISTFDYPDPTWTIANTGGINDSGTSVGL